MDLRISLLNFNCAMVYIIHKKYNRLLFFRKTNFFRNT